MLHWRGHRLRVTTCRAPPLKRGNGLLQQHSLRSCVSDLQIEQSPGQLRANLLCAGCHLDRDAADDERIALLQAVQVKAVADPERQRRRRLRCPRSHRRRLDYRRGFHCGCRRCLHDNDAA